MLRLQMRLHTCLLFACALLAPLPALRNTVNDSLDDADFARHAGQAGRQGRRPRMGPASGILIEMHALSESVPAPPTA